MRQSDRGVELFGVAALNLDTAGREARCTEVQNLKICQPFERWLQRCGAAAVEGCRRAVRLKGAPVAGDAKLTRGAPDSALHMVLAAQVTHICGDPSRDLPTESLVASDSSHQQQHEHDDEHQAQPAARPVSP